MARLLIVDDEEPLRRALRRTLERAGHEVLDASSGVEAMVALNGIGVELVLCDINMPGGSGLDLVRSISVKFPETAVIMLSGIDDPGVAQQALDIGAYGYLVKPVQHNALLINVASGLRRRELEAAQRSHVTELESKIFSRSSALRQALQRLDETESHAREAERDIVDRLVKALTLRSEETGGHIRRVARYSALLAEVSEPSAFSVEEVRLAAMLHDVGKIGIPDAILLKPGPLTDEEFDIIKRHAALGSTMLSDGKSRVLRLGAEIALTHHERWDGQGYPHGVAGHEIPLAGRIVAIADVFDALTSDRVYRAAVPVQAAIDEMTAERGTHFDPALLDSFFSLLERIEVVRSTHPDPDLYPARSTADV